MKIPKDINNKIRLLEKAFKIRQPKIFKSKKYTTQITLWNDKDYQVEMTAGVKKDLILKMKEKGFEVVGRQRRGTSLSYVLIYRTPEENEIEHVKELIQRKEGETYGHGAKIILVEDLK